MSDFLSNVVINSSNIQFGTSGARGLVHHFTPQVCGAFTANFLSTTAATYTFDTVAIGIDNRPSSYDMARACAAVVEYMGFKPCYCGVIPTPGLACFALEKKIPAIMITGSHIPFDRNGLKFYHPTGEITKSDEAVILTGSTRFSLPTRLPELPVNNDASAHYIARYTSFFPENALAGMRIGIYEHSSAGRDIYPALFAMLGAEVFSLGRSDQFVPIDTEAVSEEDRQRAINWLREYDLDAVFSTDGDGDRPLLSDEKGQWLRGDILGLLCSSHLGIDAAAVPVSSNSVISTSGLIPHVVLTRIGSPYVIAAFDALLEQFGQVAGFEANGGYLLASDVNHAGRTLKALPTRDALLPAVTVLVSSQHKKISQQLAELPPRYTSSNRLQNFSPARSVALRDKLVNDPARVLNACGLADARVVGQDMTDGVRLRLNNDDIIHLRPSGNAPELRCYAESASSDKADELVRVVLSHIEDNF
ncbi:Phosphomannomutase [Kosakonia sp. BK9b]